MATTTAAPIGSNPPRIRHRITPDHDMILIAKELETRNGQQLVVRVHEFQVSKKSLTNVEYFRVALNSQSFADTGQNHYEVKEDEPAAVKIWMQLLHDRVDDSSSRVGIATVWHVLVVARKYDLDALGKEAKAWFKSWYGKQGTKFTTLQCRQLIYPCYTFDHAVGFAAATKHLAYNIMGHIQEDRPDGVSAEQEEQRLRSRAIMALNGARGSLKTKLQADLQRPILDLIECSTLKSKKDVLWAYTAALVNTDAWPVEIKAKAKSISQLHDLLDDFEYVDLQPTSIVDHTDYDHVIQRAIRNSRDHFQGLCLDCMMSSNKNKLNEDSDYWTHAERREYDNGCRVKHGQPTWYFSFMGRKEKMDLFQKKDRTKNKD